MSDSIIDPLSDGNANGSSGGSSLGLNSTGGDKEQQVVTGVPSPGLSAPAGNDEQAGLPPALLVGGGSDATPAGQSATEGNGVEPGLGVGASKKNSARKNKGHKRLEVC